MAKSKVLFIWRNVSNRDLGSQNFPTLCPGQPASRSVLVTSAIYHILLNAVLFRNHVNTHLEMDIDELPASILVLSNDIWSKMAPHFTSFEICNMMMSSPALQNRLMRSIGELEVCTSFRSVNIFPSNFVSQFGGLKHLAIGLADPHPEHSVAGLHISMLPSTLTSLEVRNVEVLSALFGNESGWSSDPSASSAAPSSTSTDSTTLPIAPQLHQLKYLSIELWGLERLSVEQDVEWLRQVLRLPQLTHLFIPRWHHDIVGAALTESTFGNGLVHLDTNEALLLSVSSLPTSLTHLVVTIGPAFKSSHFAMLPPSLVHLRIEDSCKVVPAANLEFLKSLPAGLQSLELMLHLLSPARTESFIGDLPRGLTSLRLADSDGPADHLILPKQWHLLPKSLTNFPLHIGEPEGKNTIANERRQAAGEIVSLEKLHAELDQNVAALPTALTHATIASPLPHHITSMACLNSLRSLTITYPLVANDKVGAFDPNECFIALATVPLLETLTVYFGYTSYPSVPLGQLMAHFNHPLLDLSFQNVWFNPAHSEFDFSQAWAKRLRMLRLDRNVEHLDEQIPIENVSNEFLSSLPHSLLDLSLTLANVDNIHEALESCPPYLTSLALGTVEVSEFYNNSSHLAHLRIIHNGSEVQKDIRLDSMLSFVGENMETLHLHGVELSYEEHGWLPSELPYCQPFEDTDDEEAFHGDEYASLGGSEEAFDEYLENFDDYCEEPSARDRYGPEMFDNMPDRIHPVIALIEERCPNLRFLHHGTFVERIKGFIEGR